MFRVLVLSLAVAAATACSGEPRGDLDLAAVFDLQSDDARVCFPPSAGPTYDPWIADDASTSTWSGALHETQDYVNHDEGFRGIPIRRDEVEVALWELAIDTQLPQRLLASTQTDDEGRFEMTVDPSEMTRGQSLGFMIGDDGYIQTLSPNWTAASPDGVDLLCAYWAHPNGNQVTKAVPRGEEVVLTVRGEGGLELPSLRIREVGSDLSGDTVVASFEGEPFVDGLSETPWVVGAEDGVFEGNGVELTFSASTHLVEEPSRAWALTSAWLFAG